MVATRITAADMDILTFIAIMPWNYCYPGKKNARLAVIITIAMSILVVEVIIIDFSINLEILINHPLLWHFVVSFFQLLHLTATMGIRNYY